MIRLTDYQIASAFQPILRGIYKAKMRDINSDLADTYAHLDSLDVPRYTDFDRWFARQCLPQRSKDLLRQIDHINRIRRIKVNENRTSEELDIEKARNVPIETIYPFVRRGKNVSCPLHSDTHPSASIKYNRLVCFSCGFKGDVIALFMRLNNVEFKEAVRNLCQSN